MARKTKAFTLLAEQRLHLQTLLSKGTHPSRRIKRAQALLKLDHALSVQEVAQQVGLSLPGVYQIRQSYERKGLAASLTEKARSGRPAQLSGSERATITSLACSEPPPGHARWTLRLLANKAVELAYISKGSLSHVEVGRILKKTS
jgi:transposase